MSIRPSRRGTGNKETDDKLVALLDDLNVERNRDQIFEIFASIATMASEDLLRLDLKITNTALREMHDAFRIFEPYTSAPKVTMFGSARTLPTDPLYTQAHDTAAMLAEKGWMVVTGAGPGIMAAGMEGAGRKMSMGINIKLPFEQSANEFIDEDPKLVTMKYFFTRKLMLIKESDGFVVLPGGFGTLDEAFELLTLVQTGKAEPTPIVLMDVPGGTYWEGWQKFVEDEVARGGFISPADDVFYKITTSAEEATAELLGFFKNYHSRRFVNGKLVIRLRFEPTAEEVAALSEQFADICITGTIEKGSALPAEIHDQDELDKHRIVLHFDQMKNGRLRQLINALNGLGSVPNDEPEPRHYQEPAT